jgi:hypothetical protein
MLTSLSEAWDSSINDWVNFYLMTFTYDVDGNMLTYLYESWDSSANNWVNTSRQTNTYDVDGNMLTSLYEAWDSTTNDWVNSSRQTYTYDVDRNSTSGLYERWSNSNFAPEIGSLSIYANKTHTYNVVAYRYMATFNAFLQTSIKKPTSAFDISIYPNPASSEINININNKTLKNIQILDISGKTILEKKINTLENKFTIDLSSLESGIYIVNLQTKKEVFSSKLIIE